MPSGASAKGPKRRSVQWPATSRLLPDSRAIAYGIFARPERARSDRCELNESESVSRKPVVAGRHPTTLFDPVEEALDLVASAVKIRAEADWFAAIAFRRDISPRAFLSSFGN